MRPGPLPWTPRAHPGESLSGWVARIASRYDVTGAELCKHLLGAEAFDAGRVEQLDHRADPELLALLAEAARLPPAKLWAMRVTADDRMASYWFRTDATWCPECVKCDLARGPETYERATWRLGCTVTCSEHGVLLQHACRNCWKKARCSFRPAKGWLGLACSFCNRPPCPPDLPVKLLEFEYAGGFGALLTRELVKRVGSLQYDLQAALLDVPPQGGRGTVRSAAGLLRIVRDLTLAVVLAKDVWFEQRMELVTGLAEAPPSRVLYESFTPAALQPQTAFGLLAVVAAVLDSLDGKAVRYYWMQDGISLALNAASFIKWLGDKGRKLLRTWLSNWEPAAGAALATVMDAVANGVIYRATAT